MSDSHSRDLQFMRMARCVSERSKCGSRHVGAVLVQDGSVVSEGYNGSPRGSGFCGDGSCRRREMGYGSGQGLWECPAVHGEQNCLIQAARNGVRTCGGTLYAYCGRPCKNCMGMIINAGIKRLVYLRSDNKFYDAISGILEGESDLEVVLIDRDEL